MRFLHEVKRTRIATSLFQMPASEDRRRALTFMPVGALRALKTDSLRATDSIFQVREESNPGPKQLWSEQKQLRYLPKGIHERQLIPQNCTGKYVIFVNTSVTNWQKSRGLGLFCVFSATVNANWKAPHFEMIDPRREKGIVTLVASSGLIRVLTRHDHCT